ncbi:MAG TPA: nucleotide exchange factor GrpE [Chloroflexota bacterium]
MARNREDAGEQQAHDQAWSAAEAEPDGEDEAEPSVLRARLEEVKAQAEKNRTNWQRAEADLANFKRRVEQERADLARFGNANLIRKVLPVMDDFERALDAIPEDVRSAKWFEGMLLIDKKLRSVLEQEGVRQIDALGKEFDPHVHEAVMHEEGEGDTDAVVQEFQKGYMLHDRILRPAMVKVGKRNSQ